ncbi:MAG TPA: hypothetical protein VFJ85_17545 [Acidimicrobiales bacterium]|nr:hypothetical protein [Acidimicrobiales bacterium]
MVVAGRSTILDYGTATRTIPAPLWKALVVRDRHGRFHGCDRPAEFGEGRASRSPPPTGALGEPAALAGPPG